MTHHLGEIQTSTTSAIITGDPDRIELLVSQIEDVRHRWDKRGYVIVEAGDPPILICSTGIGGPSTAIVVEELAQLGVEHIIRLGTCGSMQPTVKAGDIVISAGAVRDEGTSLQYLPVEFPAVPDFHLLQAVVKEAEQGASPYHIGLTHSKDSYYAEKPANLPFGDWWIQRWASLRRVGVLATEMEAATLFTVAQVRKLHAAALFVPVDDSLSREQLDESIKFGFALACGAFAQLRK